MDNEERFRLTNLQWQKFMDGDSAIDTSLVPEPIVNSWIRCRDKGLDPLLKPRFETMPENRRNELLERNRQLIDIAHPYIMSFYNFMKGTGFRIALHDHNGIVLDGWLEPELYQRFLKVNAVTGACFHEEAVGTSTAGMVIQLKKPFRIFGPQHYNLNFHRDTGSGAPIFDPDGQFIGVFILAARYHQANEHTLGMAVAAARAIENELRIQRVLKQLEIANSYKNTVISSITEALIALDPIGRISLLNKNAERIFRLQGEPVVGKYLSEVFGEENRSFMEMVESGGTILDREVRIVSRGLANDFTLTCSPVRGFEGESNGKLLVLNEIKRVKNMITRMVGAEAKLRFEDICGANKRFKMTLDQARLASQSNSTVLLSGESGTGKDVFAQAIHNAGDRYNGPYLAINCGAIPRDLITSELFGYSEGAFTGSRRGGNHGKFELADGGTLFLDEIAEIPLDVQSVLLRVIEDKSVLRIGGSRVRPVNVRIIAATNKSLAEEVRKGNFREDLYYRINVFSINMIPLRERPDDIHLLAIHFIRKYEKIMQKNIEQIDGEVLKSFMAYPWPGNIRELQNVIERMMNFVKDGMLTADLIPAEITRRADRASRVPDSFKSFEQNMLKEMLDSKMTMTEIAGRMGVSRSTLYRKRRRHDLLK